MAHVLVIDDDLHVAGFLKSHLTHEGHEVTLAHHGEEGFRKAVEIHPDLILLDVFLPDATGFQVCKQIRQENATQSIPIIMMTGAARFPSQKMYGLERGANEYVSKPFDITEIDLLIHKYIERGNTEMANHAKTSMPNYNNLDGLSSFLEQSLNRPAPAPAPEPAAGAVINSANEIEELMMRIKPTAEGPMVLRFENQIMASNAMPAEPLPELTPMPLLETMPLSMPTSAPTKPPRQRLSGSFSPPVMGSKDRFVDFGLDIYTLAGRLTANEAERRLAQHLLDAALSVGFQLSEIRNSRTPADCLLRIEEAELRLRETAYWLGFAQKAGILNVFAKQDLEKTCQSLMTILKEFATQERQSQSA
jgi:four helix bundle protein